MLVTRGLVNNPSRELQAEQPWTAEQHDTLCRRIVASDTPVPANLTVPRLGLVQAMHSGRSDWRWVDCRLRAYSGRRSPFHSKPYRQLRAWCGRSR
jgi:hypothetical protein